MDIPRRYRIAEVTTSKGKLMIMVCEMVGKLRNEMQDSKLTRNRLQSGGSRDMLSREGPGLPSSQRTVRPLG